MIPQTGVNRLQEKTLQEREEGGCAKGMAEDKGAEKEPSDRRSEAGPCGSRKRVGSARAEAGSLATRGQRRGHGGSQGLGTGCPAHIPLPLLPGRVASGQSLTGSVAPAPSPERTIYPDAADRW